MLRFREKLPAFYDKRGAVCFGAAAFALMVFVLFGGRAIGLSNNGDFGRVMAASSLEFDSDDSAFAFDSTYRITLTEQSAVGNVFKILFGAEGFSNYLSLQVPIVRVSVVLNLILNKLTGGDMTLYRIEVLGMMHCVLYAGVIMFLMKQFQLGNRVFDILAKVLISIVLCDVGYLTYFNSFYGEALQLICFVFLAAMLIRIVTKQPRLADAVFCALGCTALGWSKFFNIPAACTAAVLLFGIILIKTNGTKRIAHAAVGIMTLCILAAIYISIPSWMSLQTKYNAIFFGALKDTETTSCQRYLSELGLPREFVRYRNTNVYVEGIEHELIEGGHDEDIMAVSNLDIASFYLRHPDRLFHAASVSLMNAGAIRPFYLSNYDDAAPKLTFSHRFSFWSVVRSAAGFNTWLGFAGVISVFALSVFSTMKRAGRKWHEILSVFLFSAGILAYFFIVPFMSNGEGDLAKHLFAYAQLTDMMVLFVITVTLHGLRLKKPLPIPVGCLVMAICLAFVPVKTGLSHMLSLNRQYIAPEKGAYITYGTHAGSSLLWQVTEKDNGVMTLLCARTVAYEQFSSDGSNAWAASSLRQWLNTSFLSSFSDYERNRLLPVDNSVLLSRETKGAAVSGNRDFYFSPVPILAARGYDEAYQTVTKDIVALPGIDLVSDLSADGAAIALSEAYWLDTPYFNNGYMVRCIVPDGRILMREASELTGVRPVIHIEIAVPVSGTGSYKDPFVL